VQLLNDAAILNYRAIQSTLNHKVKSLWHYLSTACYTAVLLLRCDRLIMSALRPLCYGLSLCGAGGGGIAVLLLKAPGLDAVRAAVTAAGQSPLCADITGVTVHAAAVDGTGMVCRALQQPAVDAA
jgi:hypothetical protein